MCIHAKANVRAIRSINIFIYVLLNANLTLHFPCEHDGDHMAKHQFNHLIIICFLKRCAPSIELLEQFTLDSM